MLQHKKLDSLAEETPSQWSWNRLGASSNRLLPLIVFLIMFMTFSIFANNFFTVRGVLNLLVQTSTFTILGIGALMVLVVGCIDFSLGAVVAVAGTAMIMFAAMGIPIWLSLIAASLASGLIGLVNGFLVAKVHLPSFITTFAMAMVIYGLLVGFWGFLDAYAGPPPHPENLDHLGDMVNNPAFKIVSHDANGAEIVLFPGISWIVIIMIAVAVLSHLLLEKTRFGRYAFLVGSNPEACRFSGIKVIRVKILAFALASMLAGLVGALLTSRLGMPAGAAAGYEMIAIEIAMIGGASLSGGSGNVGQTVIGSFLISTLAMGIAMTNVNQIYLPLFLNGLILLAVVYLDQSRNKK